MKIVVDHRAPALHHMQKDSSIISSEIEKTIIRFYEWSDFCITYGLFVDPERFIKRSEDIELVRRPTGGGLLFHERDLAFSLFLPKSSLVYSLPIEKSCAQINQAIYEALGIEKCVISSNERCQLCMAQATPYDIIYEGYKIGGCAERRTRYGLLHQVSLFLEEPDWEKIEGLLIDRANLQTMQEGIRTFSRIDRDELQSKLFEKLRGVYG